jgi:hypothetical protein
MISGRLRVRLDTLLLIFVEAGIRYNFAMRLIGRGCQLVALLGLPSAIPLQLAGVIELKQMLALMAAAFCLFYLGRLIEGYARAS